MSWCRQKRNGLLLANIFLLSICVYITTGNPIPSIFDANTLPRDSDGFYILSPSHETAGSYEKAAVATSSNQCAEVGAKILKKGGSAVDAGIATLLCDGVVSIQGLGIGGGFLMTIWDAQTQKPYFLNAREYAPAAAHEKIFTVNNAKEATTGVKAIAVPGEIAGYWEAHKRFGKLAWRELFEDAIKICEEGLKVSRYIANDIRKMVNELNKPQFSALKNILVSPKKKLKDVGEIIKIKELAHTLKKIRDYGKHIFYEGEIAENLVREIQAAGGIITLEDFKNYRPQWKEPVNTTIDNKIMYSAPTPGSGAVLAFIMNILQEIIPSAPNENVLWQRMAETFKWAYARRTELGDFIERSEYAEKKSKADCKVKPEDVEMYKEAGYAFAEQGDQKWDKDCLMAIAVKKLLSKEYAEEVIALIEDDKTYNDYLHYNVTQQGAVDFGTAHTSIYAEDGSAVAVSSTINHVFGSLVLSESTGIILNNQMDDYSYPEIRNGFGMEASEFNFVRNGTSNLRPMSSMSPTIILNQDKTVRLIIGGAGGTKITTGVIHGIIFNLLLGKDIKTSIDHPRIHHQLWPMAVQREPDFDPKIDEYFKSIGHNLTEWLIMQNTIAAVAVNGPNNITASGDYRREGGTDGY